MRDDLKAAFRALGSSTTFTIVALIVLARRAGVRLPLSLSFAALLASAIPARRAATIDPREALRAE